MANDAQTTRRGAGRGCRIEKQYTSSNRRNESSGIGSDSSSNSDQMIMGGVKTKSDVVPGRGRGGRVIGAQKDESKLGGGGDASIAKTPNGERRVNSSSPSGISPDRNIEKELKKMELAELAKRPSFGSSGRRIHLLANHFEVKISGGKSITLARYHIEITHRRMKLTRDENRICFWKVINDNYGIFPSAYAVAIVDSRQCFSLNRQKFPNDSAAYKFEFEIQLNREDKPSEVAVLFQHVGAVALDLRTVHTAALTDRSMIPIQAIDVILRQGRPNSVLYEQSKDPFGHSVFMILQDLGVDLGGGREIWHGLFTSVVNMDVSHSAFIKPVTVVDYLIDVLNSVSSGGCTRKQSHTGVELSDIERKVFETETKGLRVINRRQGSVREFRVNGIGSANVSGCWFASMLLLLLVSPADCASIHRVTNDVAFGRILIAVLVVVSLVAAFVLCACGKKGRAGSGGHGYPASPQLVVQEFVSRRRRQESDQWAPSNEESGRRGHREESGLVMTRNDLT